MRLERAHKGNTRDKKERVKSWVWLSCVNASSCEFTQRTPFDTRAAQFLFSCSLSTNVYLTSACISAAIVALSFSVSASFAVTFLSSSAMSNLVLCASDEGDGQCYIDMNLAKSLSSSLSHMVLHSERQKGLEFLVVSTNRLR